MILFEPAYDSYIPAIQLAGATPVLLPLQVPGYRIDWDSVRRALSPRTRMIVLNTPNNPGTSVLSAEDVAMLAAVTRSAHRRDQRRSLRTHGVRRGNAPEPRAPCRARRAQRGDRIVRQDVPRHRLEGRLRAGTAGDHGGDPACAPVHRVHRQQSGAARTRGVPAGSGALRIAAAILRAQARSVAGGARRHAVRGPAMRGQLLPARTLRPPLGRACGRVRATAGARSRRGDHSAVRLLS